MYSSVSPEWKKLLRRLTGVAGDRDAAEDALQDAYVRLEAYGRDHAVQHARALFVRTATNLALDHRRRAARTAAGDVADLEAVLADAAPLPDEVLASRQRLAIVQGVMAQLPPRTREVFMMHRLDGLKYREIAARLGVSVSAVEKHVARATLRLTQAFAPDGPWA